MRLLHLSGYDSHSTRRKSFLRPLSSKDLQDDGGDTNPTNHGPCPCLVLDSPEQFFIRKVARLVASPKALGNGGDIRVPRTSDPGPP